MNRFTFTLILYFLISGLINLSAQNRLSYVDKLNERALGLLRSDPDSSELLLSIALNEANAADYSWGKATATHISGRLFMLKKREIEAITKFEESLELYEQTDSIFLSNHYIIYWNISTIYYRNNAFKAAAVSFKKSHEVLSKLVNNYPDHQKSINRETDLMDAIYFEAVALKKAGDLKRAGALLKNLWSNNARPGVNNEYYAKILNQLGLINKDLLNFDEARYFYRQILELAETNRMHTSRALHNIGFTWLLEGEYQKAENYLREALSQKINLAKTKSSRRSLYISYLDLGEALFRQGNYTGALSQWQLALSMNIDISGDPDLFIVHNWLQQCYMLFDVDKANFHGDQFRAHSQAFNNSKESIEAKFEGQVFRLHLEESRIKAAYSQENKAQRALFRTIGVISLIGLVLITLGWILRRRIRHHTYYKKMHQIATKKPQ